MILPINEINPRLLRCSYFNGFETMPSTKMTKRVCYDYEIEYYLKSNGGIIVDDKYVHFKQGEMNIRKPGQVVCGVAPYECYIICFSMKGNDVVSKNYDFGSALNAQPLYENSLLSLLPDKFIPKTSQHVFSIIREIFLTSRNMCELDNLKVNMLLYKLIFEILSQCKLNSSEDVVNVKVKKAVQYITNNFCSDLCINKIIAETGLSKAYFHRCFKDYTKTTPRQMIISLRVEKAKTLLCITQNSIYDIATLCGFYDNVYFSHIFKKVTGFTPTEYKNKNIML